MELLNKIQRELKVPKEHQKAGLPYKYRNAEDILEAVKPLLGKDGTLILSDTVVLVGDRYYVKATATLSDGKEACSTEAFARETLTRTGTDDAKITGAASSYARKYALNGLFCIDDTKDADNDESAPQTKPEANAGKPIPPKKVGDAQRAEIKALCDEKALVPLIDGTDYQKYVYENTALNLEESNFGAIIERLKAMK
jgi:hypothetical protein